LGWRWRRLSSSTCCRHDARGAVCDPPPLWRRVRRAQRACLQQPGRVWGGSTLPAFRVRAASPPAPACAPHAHAAPQHPTHTHHHVHHAWPPSAQVHGFPKVLGVLTHLDGFREPSKLKKAKKALKVARWWCVWGGGGGGAGVPACWRAGVLGRWAAGLLGCARGALLRAPTLCAARPPPSTHMHTPFTPATAPRPPPPCTHATPRTRRASGPRCMTAPSCSTCPACSTASTSSER
jgi:hypothetical protein